MNWRLLVTLAKDWCRYHSDGEVLVIYEEKVRDQELLLKFKYGINPQLYRREGKDNARLTTMRASKQCALGDIVRNAHLTQPGIA